jgi:hypothetical protein
MGKRDTWDIKGPECVKKFTKERGNGTDRSNTGKDEDGQVSKIYESHQIFRKYCES